MKQVLGERGVNVSKMETENTREKLQNIHDFEYGKTEVESWLLETDTMDMLYLWLSFTVS